MHVINARNVREAYVLGMTHLLAVGERTNSRAGEVLVAPTPVTTVYQRPVERVLLDARRDANPVFSLMEALWMLAGRQDGEFLDRYVSTFSRDHAESEDGRIHDAYGYRWRRHLGYDQLDRVVTTLQRDPASRQCVIQMWDAVPGHIGDIAYIGADDLRGLTRTRPCNTHVYLRVRDGVLDLTVCCRSNDMIFGGYGSNAVHFSVLQEYLAARIGVGVGVMYQVSNNFHAYVELGGRPQLGRVLETSDAGHYLPPAPAAPYDDLPLPLVDEPRYFDDDLRLFFNWIETGGAESLLRPEGRPIRNVFLSDVAVPLATAYAAWRRGPKFRPAARGVVQSSVVADDWRRATLEWMDRRLERAQL